MLIQPGRGNTAPLPEGAVILLTIGGVLLGAFLLFVIVYAMTGVARSRKKSARLLASGVPASARVILLQERPNVPGYYELTLEVAAEPPFVAKSLAIVPLEALPSVVVGATVQVRFDRAEPSTLVIDHPAIACQFN